MKPRRIDKAIALKETIKREMDLIAAAEIIPDDKETMTLFVHEMTEEMIGCSNSKHLDVTAIVDESVKEKLLSNFTIWSNETTNIEHYSIDFPCQELASCNIAKASIEKYGIDTCCAVILSDFLYWGYDEEEREKQKEEVNSLYVEIKEHPEKFEKHDILEPISNLCTDDEKTYYFFEKEFNEKVADIERRYQEEIIKKNEDLLKEI